MIGDWVRTEAGALIVAGVGHKIYCRANDGNPTHLWEVTSIEPIPLTPEILEKNGFEYFHKNFASLDHDSAFRIEMVNWPDEFGNGGLWIFAELIKIRYVHDLQHCLRLCEINKKIFV